MEIDIVDAFLNELEYQKQIAPKSSGTAALQWAHDEIARLRAALQIIIDRAENCPDTEAYQMAAIAQAHMSSK